MTASLFDHPAVNPQHPVTMMWGRSPDLTDLAYVSAWRDVGYKA